MNTDEYVVWHSSVMSGQHTAYAKTELNVIYYIRNEPIWFPPEVICEIFLIQVCAEQRTKKSMARKIQPHLIHLLQHHRSLIEPEIKQDTEPVTG